MNLDTAKLILPWCGIQARDKNGRAAAVICPAHPDRKTTVARYCRCSIASEPTGVRVTCRAFAVVGSEADDGEPCRPNASGILCYHCIAALMLRADDAGGSIYLYGVNNSDKASEDASKGGGRVLPIFAGDASKPAALAVFFPPAPKQSLKSSPVHDLPSNPLADAVKQAVNEKIAEQEQALAPACKPRKRSKQTA